MTTGAPSHPSLHVVSDRRLTGPEQLVQTLIAAAGGGASTVHLREPDLDAAQLYDLAVALRRGLSSAVRLIVNDRIDVALAAGADGVQLGRRSLTVDAARRVAPARFQIGASCHSVAEAVVAERAGADFVFLGTIYPSRSHPNAFAVGPSLIAAVRKQVGIPIIGIGGITSSNAFEVIAAGASGVAVISAVLGRSEPGLAAAEILASMAPARCTSRPDGQVTG